MITYETHFKYSNPSDALFFMKMFPKLSLGRCTYLRAMISLFKFWGGFDPVHTAMSP